MKQNRRTADQTSRARLQGSPDAFQPYLHQVRFTFLRPCCRIRNESEARTLDVRGAESKVMRLGFGVLAYLCGMGALVSAVVVGFQVMVGPANSGNTYTTASSTSSSVPSPRAEPKRVEPINPVNEPAASPKYEVSSVPLTSTAAYNKKKAKEQYGQRSTQRKHKTPKISDEAANSYGSNSYGLNSFGWGQNNWGQNNAPRPRRQGEWSIY